MTELVRFNNWIFDREQIELITIFSKDGKNHDDFDKVEHTLSVKLKSKDTFHVVCEDLYNAQKELDFLTARINPICLENKHGNHLIKVLYDSQFEIMELHSSIKKLMKAFSKQKTK